MRVQLRVLSGARAGHVEVFSKPYIGLGRHPQSDVRLDAEQDLDVSARHAAIVYEHGAFAIRDVGSNNGTLVNGRAVTGDVVLKNGDVIGLGSNGPTLEVLLLADPDFRQPVWMRRTTTVVLSMLLIGAVGFAWIRSRQRAPVENIGVDYRGISRRNADAVALVIVQFSRDEIVSGTGFAVDSQGTIITNKHVLTGRDGNRQPTRIAVKFSGSAQWFRAQLVGVAPQADLGAIRVDIRGGTPRVADIARDAPVIQRGEPVAILGYPLGEDLPMEHQREGTIADPTLTAGIVSKVLPNLVQLDAYGAPGSSGSPVFDRAGRVVAVLYGGDRDAHGKIVFAVPGPALAEYLQTLERRR